MNGEKSVHGWPCKPGGRRRWGIITHFLPPWKLWTWTSFWTWFWQHELFIKTDNLQSLYVHGESLMVHWRDDILKIRKQLLLPCGHSSLASICSRSFVLGLSSICHLSKYHYNILMPTPPPQFCITIVFSFSWDDFCSGELPSNSVGRCHSFDEP